MSAGELQQYSYALQTRAAQPVSSIKPAGGGSDFTRRKNWSQNVLDELRDLVIVLSNEFKIIFCSEASVEFLGYSPAELNNHLFTEYIHVDDVDSFSREFRTARDTMQALRIYHRVQRKDGNYTLMETNGHFYRNTFIGSVRKIPTEASRAMDSFLDLKIENEQLKQRLAQLKEEQQKQQAEEEEEEEEAEDLTRPVQLQEDQETLLFTMEEEAAPFVYTPGISMSYDISQSLEMFTGLHYDMGERSKGISLGLEGDLTTVPPDTHLPAVIGPVDRQPVSDSNSSSADEQNRGKKKKLDASEPKICTDCGTTQSPEWRKGPQGPKTLCNACGLRWAKSHRKQVDRPAT
jgi:PAS domain S-box-containing protein